MDQKTTGELMHARGVTASKLISAAQIQRNYGYQILDGRRSPSRDKVISLCLALKLELPETQRALTLTKKRTALFQKQTGFHPHFCFWEKAVRD